MKFLELDELEKHVNANPGSKVYVKIKRNHELFWVQVLKFEQDKCIGVVDNDLVCQPPGGIKYGDEITVAKNEIIMTLK